MHNRRQAAEEVPVTSCAGRVLAEEIAAPVDVPGFSRAAMDGYAIVAEESFGATSGNPLSLGILGESLPGRPHEGGLKRGQAVRIMTGAPIPGGADCVIPVEATDDGDESVVIEEAPSSRHHIRRRGEIVSSGGVLMESGSLLTPGAIHRDILSGCPRCLPTTGGSAHRRYTAPRSHQPRGGSGR